MDFDFKDDENVPVEIQNENHLASFIKACVGICEGEANVVATVSESTPNVVDFRTGTGDRYFVIACKHLGK